jgi:hypothetical protein
MSTAVLALAWTLAAPAAFDHSAFDALLRAHVAQGLVDYDAFAKDPSFARYLDALSRAKVDALPEPERLAFWINAYNAYTIQLVNAHRERESIRNINKVLGLGKGPWKEPIVRAGGQTLTLDQVEHEIVRKRFREPRIHFALVCAARGCPPLRPEAYTGARLEAQLDEQARAFLARSPERNRVDVAARTVHLSPILDWYREDFGGTKAAVGRYVAAYLPAGPAKELLLAGDFTLAYTDYDWSLNKR